MREYKCLPGKIWHYGKYSMVPIRDNDKYDIINWRNAQMEFLRQDSILSKVNQEYYFEHIVNPLFGQSYPDQILWSILLQHELIAYGGLVHINWNEKKAEVSFLNKTDRAKNHHLFEEDWSHYLKILKPLAFDTLGLSSIFTYSFDNRSQLYPILEKNGFELSSLLQNAFIKQNKLTNALIHTCDKLSISYRMANPSDCLTYYNWANDESVRFQSFHQEYIDYPSHQLWFDARVRNPKHFLLVFENYISQAIGQVRIEPYDNEEIVHISLSVDKDFRGKGFAYRMVQKATSLFKNDHPGIPIIAFIKESNNKSFNVFLKAGFTQDSMIKINGENSYKLILK